MTLTIDTQKALEALPRALREKAPLVHCLTNLVVSNFTANVLLALGASPAMVTAPEETEEFAAISNALLINLGTLDTQQVLSMRFAIQGARRAGRPWVLDPVAASLPFRLETATRLLREKPAVIRGNASEIMAIAYSGRVLAKGADSLAKTEEAIEAAELLAKQYETVVAVSGEKDYLTDGRTRFYVTGGHAWMTRVTGVGCALNAAIAAYTAIAPSPLLGTLAALCVFAEAGERAGSGAQGTGSFALAFMDALSQANTLNVTRISV